MYKLLEDTGGEMVPCQHTASTHPHPHAHAHTYLGRWLVASSVFVYARHVDHALTRTYTYARRRRPLHHYFASLLFQASGDSPQPLRFLLTREH